MLFCLFLEPGVYSIGDTIEFAGSNWRVIKDSTAEEDYITLMNEIIENYDIR